MSNELLLEGERLDEVNDRLRLIQKTNGLTFGTDALLLAAFIKKRGERALELGGGSGIISMLLAARGRFSHILCAEVQEAYAELIRRNVALNQLDDVIIPLCADIRDTSLLGRPDSYNAVFTNPPYMTVGDGYACRSDAKNIARHEICGVLEDFVSVAARMLRYGGSFYAVYRTERMDELLAACRAHGLAPKRLTTVHARLSLPPSMLLLEARKGGGAGLRVSRPLILTDGDGSTADSEYFLANGILPEDF